MEIIDHRIIIVYPDGTQKELVGDEKIAYEKEWSKRYENRPFPSSGLTVEMMPTTMTGYRVEAIDRLMFQHLDNSYAKCDYCKTFQVRNKFFEGTCQRCGAPLPKPLTIA